MKQLFYYLTIILTSIYLFAFLFIDRTPLIVEESTNSLTQEEINVIQSYLNVLDSGI